MTKQTPSGRTPLSVFYRCPRLIQTLSILSSLSFISSGLVLAQVDSPSDSGAAPKAPASFVDAGPEPAPAPKPVARSKPAAPASLVEPDIPVRRSAPEPEAPAQQTSSYRQRRSEEAPAQQTSSYRQRRSEEGPARPLAPRRARKTEAPTQAPVVRRERKPEVSTSASELPVLTIRRRKPTKEKPTLAPPNLSVPDATTVAKPPKLMLSPAQTEQTAKIPSAPGNSYIDRTDYSVGSTRRYEGPSAVVLTERSTGCITKRTTCQWSLWRRCASSRSGESTN
jgi:hypothetical protein